MCFSYAFPRILYDTQRKAPREKKKSDAPEGSKKWKMHSSYKRGNKLARVEDTLDPLTTSPVLFSSDTDEAVIAFKGVVHLLFYANDKEVECFLY